ncbi:MAG: porin [Kiloniellaceae bacterium]
MTAIRAATWALIAASLLAASAALADGPGPDSDRDELPGGPQDARVRFESLTSGNPADVDQLTYFTPRFGGLPAALSYPPGLIGGAAAETFSMRAGREPSERDGIGLGVNLAEIFDRIDVAAGFGYRLAARPDDPIRFAPDGLEGWSLGLNLGGYGFTIGGSYSSRAEGHAPAGGLASTEGRAFDLGASYATGPWQFGITYFQSAVQGFLAQPDDDEMKSLEAGVALALRPGMTAGARVLYSQRDSDIDSDSEGHIGIVGIRVDF